MNVLVGRILGKRIGWDARFENPMAKAGPPDTSGLICMNENELHAVFVLRWSSSQSDVFALRISL
jgi:hypothetical protein